MNQWLRERNEALRKMDLNWARTRVPDALNDAVQLALWGIGEHKLLGKKNLDKPANSSQQYG